MKNNIKTLLAVLITIIGLNSSKKAEYTIGDIKTPANLTLTATVAGVRASAPNGGGTGNVAITTTASDAFTYKIDFCDGNTQMVPSGVFNYMYNNPGTFDYTITVTAS